MNQIQMSFKALSQSCSDTHTHTHTHTLYCVSLYNICHPCPEHITHSCRHLSALTRAKRSRGHLHFDVQMDFCWHQHWATRGVFESLFLLLTPSLSGTSIEYKPLQPLAPAWILQALRLSCLSNQALLAAQSLQIFGKMQEELLCYWAVILHDQSSLLCYNTICTCYELPVFKGHLQLPQLLSHWSLGCIDWTRAALSWQLRFYDIGRLGVLSCLCHHGVQGVHWQSTPSVFSQQTVGFLGF